MPIAYFSAHQTDVFIPALIVLLLVTAAVAAPVLLWPGIRRARTRQLAVAAVAVVAAVGLVAAALLAVPGFGTLARQVDTLQSDLHSRYGLVVTRDEATRLINGDSIPLTQTGQSADVHLADTGEHRYVLTTKGVDAELPLKK